jgi:integrase
MLWDICQREYFTRNLRVRSPITRMRYLYAIRDFGAFLKRPATLDDLDDDTLTEWLTWLVDVRGLAARSANGEADRVRAVWNWLAKRGRVSRFPTFGKLAEEARNPVAWSPDELRALFTAAGKMPGMVGPFKASVWWEAWLAWLWNTGERLSASLDMRWEHVDLAKGVAVLPPSIRKGQRKGAVYHLWPDTCAMLARLQRTSGEVFYWNRTVFTYFLHYSKLLKLAELPTGRNRKTHAMRVSHATWLVVAGGDATRSLKHSNPATTAKHYLDERFTAPRCDLLFRPWEKA